MIRATSFITAGISVATVVSLPLGSFVASVSTWRVAFLIGAVLGVIALIGQLAMLPKIESRSRVRFATLGGLLAVPKARIGLIVTVFVFIAQFAAYTYVAPYLEDIVKVDASTITLALLVFGVAGIIGNFVAGATLSRNLVGTLGVSKFVLAAAVIALPLLAWSVPGVFVLLAVWGFVWGGLPLGMQTWMAKAAPSASESSLALFVTTIQLSLAAGSILGGVAVSGFGLGFDFAMAGVIAAVGAILLITLGVRRTPALALTPVVATTTGAVEVPC